MTGRQLEAEHAVIGSILIDPGCLETVERMLTPDDFALVANRAIYQAALSLRSSGSKVDPVLIRQEVLRSGGEVSGAYLVELMDITPTAANVEEYARLTREAALGRGILTVTQDCRQRLEEGTPPAQVLADAARRLDDLERQGTAGALIDPQGAMLAFLAHRDAVDAGQAKGYVPTGYRDVDDLLGGGMLQSGMYVLAARPGMGKTTLALNIADRVAKGGGGVLFVSLEMDVEQLQAKRIARESGVSGSRLLMQQLGDEEYRKVQRASDILLPLPVYLNRKPTATVDEIALMARQVPGLSLVIVDYLGKISPGARRSSASRYEYTTEISGDLKTLARTLRLPVLVLAQLNRASEGRQDRRPQLSDLRDTGAIEQDADGVLFVYRPSYYGEEGGANPYAPEPLEVIVAKNRHGATGTCELAFALAASKVTAVSNDPRRAWRRSEALRGRSAGEEESHGDEQSPPAGAAGGGGAAAQSLGTPRPGAGGAPSGDRPGAGARP